MNTQLRRRQYKSLNRDATPKVQTKLPKLMNFHHSFFEQTTPHTRTQLPEISTLPPSNRRKSNESIYFDPKVKKENALLKHKSRDKSQMSLKTNPDTHVSQGEKEATVVLGTLNKIPDEESPSLAKVDIAKEIETNYNQFVYNKILEKERLQSARAKVAQIEEEKREKYRKKFDDKERKRQSALSNLLQRQKLKIKEIEETRKDKKQRLEEIESTFNLSSREKYQNLMTKLERSNSKKKELDIKKSQKLFMMNTLLSEKQHSMLERKEKAGSMIHSNLLGIESRLAQTTDRKKRYLEEKINRSQKYLSLIDEKHKRALEVQSNLQQSLVQKVFTKMTKVRSKSAIAPLKYNDNDEHDRSDFRIDFKKRFELVTQKRMEEENFRLSKMKEKEMRMRNKSEQRKDELLKFAQEKRFEWKQRMNSVQRNKKTYSSEANKKFDEMLTSYKTRIDNILSTKTKRREILERLERSFNLGLVNKSSILTDPNLSHLTAK